MLQHSHKGDHAARRVEDVIVQYLAQPGLKDMVSVRRAVAAVRTVVADSGRSDEELAQLVAFAAIQAGKNIAFDLREDSPFNQYRLLPPSPVAG